MLRNKEEQLLITPEHQSSLIVRNTPELTDIVHQSSQTVWNISKLKTQAQQFIKNARTK